MLETKAKASRVHFTKDAINRIPVPAMGRTYTYDEKVRGLAVCTTTTGTKSFYLYRKVDGKPERHGWASGRK